MINKHAAHFHNMENSSDEFLDDKELIDYYYTHEELTTQDKYDRICELRKNIELEVLDYANILFQIQCEMTEIVEKKEQELFELKNDNLKDNTNEEWLKELEQTKFTEGDSIYTDPDEFDNKYLSDDSEYFLLKINLPAYKLSLDKKLNSKYYIEEILSSLKGKTGTPKILPPSKKKTSIFNQVQIAWLFDQLRINGVFDKGARNVMLAESINMLTGKSSLQSAKCLSTPIDDDEFNRNHKEGIKKLLEDLLKELK